MCVGNIYDAVMGFDTERDAARIGDCLKRFCLWIYPRDAARLRRCVNHPA